MSNQRGQGKNRVYLHNKLKEMFGDEFEPILRASEQALRLHAMAMDSDDSKVVKDSIDAWIRINKFFLPELKAVEHSQDPDNPLFEKDEDARFSELNRIQEIISRRSGETDRTETGGTEIH